MHYNLRITWFDLKALFHYWDFVANVCIIHQGTKHNPIIDLFAGVIHDILWDLLAMLNFNPLGAVAGRSERKLVIRKNSALSSCTIANVQW